MDGLDGRPGSLAKFLALNSQPRKLLATDLPHRLKDLRHALHGIAAAETWRDGWTPWTLGISMASFLWKMAILSGFSHIFPLNMVIMVI